jgi:hypothetical protein
LSIYIIILYKFGFKKLAIVKVLYNMVETKKECQETETDSVEYDQIGLDLDLD